MDEKWVKRPKLAAFEVAKYMRSKVMSMSL